MTPARRDTEAAERPGRAEPPLRLTQFSPGGGCACKLPQQLLDDLHAGWFDPDDCDPAHQLLLADAQTSGGLLLAAPDARLDTLLTELDRRGETGAVVGELVDGPAGTIRVEPRPHGGEEHP